MRLVNIFYKFKKYLNVIIVEDGSRKEIILYNKKLLKKYSNVKYFSYKKNQGQSFACNFESSDFRNDSLTKNFSFNTN